MTCIKLHNIICWYSVHLLAVDYCTVIILMHIHYHQDPYKCYIQLHSYMYVIIMYMTITYYQWNMLFANSIS